MKRKLQSTFPTYSDVNPSEIAFQMKKERKIKKGGRDLILSIGNWRSLLFANCCDLMWVTDCWREALVPSPHTSQHKSSEKRWCWDGKCDWENKNCPFWFYGDFKRPKSPTQGHMIINVKMPSLTWPSLTALWKSHLTLLLILVSYFCFLCTQKVFSSFIKLRLNHWCHMDYFNNVLTTSLGLERDSCVAVYAGSEGSWI